MAQIVKHLTASISGILGTMQPERDILTFSVLQEKIWISNK